MVSSMIVSSVPQTHLSSLLYVRAHFFRQRDAMIYTTRVQHACNMRAPMSRRELCFSSWLTARVVKARFVRHLVDPLYFHEWAPFEGTPDELMEARRDKLSSLVKLRGSIHNVNKPEVGDL